MGGKVDGDFARARVERALVPDPRSLDRADCRPKSSRVALLDLHLKPDQVCLARDRDLLVRPASTSRRQHRRKKECKDRWTTGLPRLLSRSLAKCLPQAVEFRFQLTALLEL